MPVVYLIAAIVISLIGASSLKGNIKKSDVNLYNSVKSNSYYEANKT